MSKFPAALLLLPVFLLAGCERKPAASVGDIRVIDPWARPAAEGGNSAAYMVIRNTGASSDRLVAAECPEAGMTEIHETTMKDDVMGMAPVDAVVTPARGEASLKPGSFHVMLMQLRKEIRTGETITVTLTFEKAGRVSVEVPVAQR